MKLLPKWALTNLRPTIYDAESGSVIEQTAKVYGAMNELIEEYNKFADSWNSKIEVFMSDVNADNETFRVALRQEFQDFIDVVVLKIAELDQYTKNVLASEIERIYKELAESDEVQEIMRSEISSFETEIQSLINENESTMLSNFNSFKNEINGKHSTMVSDFESFKNEINESINEMDSISFFELGFDTSTGNLSFKNGQTAEQLFILLENNKPVYVRYNAGVGYVVLNNVQKLTIPTLGTAYLFQAIIDTQMVSYRLTQSGFSERTTTDLVSFAMLEEILAGLETT